MPNRSTAALLAAALGSCAIPPDDVHLAPLYSHHRLAAGGSDHEALGGILEVRSENATPTRPAAHEFALRPLFRRRVEGTSIETDVLWPLGHFRTDAEEGYGRFFPFWWWTRRPNEEGREEIDWAVFPLLFGGSDGADNTYFAVFPFGGTLRDYFAYDRITFVLFPIYGETEKSPGHQRGQAILFPITGWGSGDDGESWWRFWPFYGHSSNPGRYDRTFVLWPFWHSERDFLNTEQPSDEWFLFPFYGQVERGSFHARSVLWPFFGWDWNDETGYSAYDGPWPLVKVVQRGAGFPISQTRALPFYAQYRSEEIDSRTYGWPIVWVRKETTPDYQKTSIYVVPFFYSSRSTYMTPRDPASRPAGKKDQTAVDASTDMVWPFYRQGTLDDGSSTAEALWPLPYPKLRGFRENWFPFFSLFSRQESDDGAVSERAVLDLFRRESNRDETRWSLPILGGHRSTADGVSEWSLLLGLIRWESGPSGTRLLMPAIPGPGFSVREAAR